MQTTARILYILALALLTVMTVGFGVVTFYPGPTMPEYPITAPKISAPSATPTAAEQQAEIDTQNRYQADQKAYTVANKAHARIELSIVTGIGVLILLAGLVAAAAPDVLRVGLMLGGIFTVVWGLIANANAAGSGVMFAVAALAMVILGAFSLGAPRRMLGRVFGGGGADLLGPHV